MYYLFNYKYVIHVQKNTKSSWMLVICQLLFSNRNVFCNILGTND